MCSGVALPLVVGIFPGSFPAPGSHAPRRTWLETNLLLLLQQERGQEVPMFVQLHPGPTHCSPWRSEEGGTSRGWWLLARIPPRPKELLTSRATREVHLSREPLARGQIARHGPEQCSTLGPCLPGTAGSGRRRHAQPVPPAPWQRWFPPPRSQLINSPIMQIEK